MLELGGLDPDAGETLYLQVARAIREQIVAGTVELGERLPSAREISSGTGIGRQVYGRAIDELKREGLLVVRPGLGVYVAVRPLLKVIDLHPGDQVGVRAAAEEERARLGMGALIPLLTVTRADGAEEVYSGAVTRCRVPVP